MVGQGRAVYATPPKAAPRAFTMRRLWRLVTWGAMAASALLIVVLSARSEVGSQRIAVALGSFIGSSHRPGQVTTVTVRPPDGEADTRRLSEAVRALAADRDKLEARLTAVEHSIEDSTGSIARQPAAAAWPDPEPLVPAGATSLATLVASAEPAPPSRPVSPVVPLATVPAAAPTIPAPSSATPPRQEFAVYLGSAFAIEALRARWAELRTARPQLFTGLRAVVTAKETSRPNRRELRLMAGPLASIEAATRLCASIAPLHLPCQPGTFDGQHIALQ